MAGAVEKLIEPEDFLRWCLTQEGRYELVDGVVRPLHEMAVDPSDGRIRAMAGAPRRHDRIVSNIHVAVGLRLRGSPCFPHTADFAIRTSRRTLRRPDLLIDCGTGGNDELEAKKPTVVFEVLSPSTRQMDLVRKLDEYKQTEGLRHVVLVEQGVAVVVAYSRNDDTSEWIAATLEDLSDTIDLSAIKVELPMAEVYADVEFDPA